MVPSWQEGVGKKQTQLALDVLQEQSRERGPMRALLRRGARPPVVPSSPSDYKVGAGRGPVGEQTGCVQQRKGLTKTKPDPSGEHATPDLGVVISSPTLGTEIT